MSSIPISKSLTAELTLRSDVLTPRTFYDSGLQFYASRIGLRVCCCVLAWCFLIFAAISIHWPLAGDATLMHYIAFLMDHGNAPYRDIADYNFPGAYLIDYAVMHTLGGGSLAWRMFDFGLVLSGGLAMISIARPYGRSGGFIAGLLLALVHGCDGIYELGQRDFVIAILLLVGYASLFHAWRNNSPGWVFAFGVCMGLSGTIKPTFLPLGLLLLLSMILGSLHGKDRRWAYIYWGFAGWIMPLVGAFIFLLRTHAISDFIKVTRGIMLYHASLGRRPVSYLLIHSFAPLMPMVVIWVCCVFGFRRNRISWERTALLIGMSLALGSYVLQGKGYSYQRYPFFAILLLVMSIDSVRAVKRDGLLRILGWTGIAFGTIFLAPVSVAKASRYNWQDVEFQTMLQGDLRQMGGKHLSGEVQCIDTIGGCFDVLYRMRLVEAEGFSYDEFLFGSSADKVVAESRRAFWEKLQAKPPEVIVMTDGLFPSGPGNFRKLERWPEFDAYLRHYYKLRFERRPPHPVHWWSKTQEPPAYRIYSRD